MAGIAVGRHLDRHSPRALMTIGSIAGTALVLAWSQVGGLLAIYAIWIAIGLVMAAVLYEPAFTVLAKQFDDAGERRRAMTAMTLVAALASFVFMPLAQMLIDAHGWRDALIMLVGTLARATAIAELYGAGSYGTIAAVAGFMTTAARAVAPVAAAVYAGLVGYSSLLWTLAALAATAAVLAWRAEHVAAEAATAIT